MRRSSRRCPCGLAISGGLAISAQFGVPAERIGYAPGVITSSSIYDRTGGSQATAFAEAVAVRHASGTFAWIDVTDPVAGDFDHIAAALQLHELAVEDAIEAGQRPKVERYDDTSRSCLQAHDVGVSGPPVAADTAHRALGHELQAQAETTRPGATSRRSG